jgi:hypothetical protein
MSSLTPLLRRVILLVLLESHPNNISESKMRPLQQEQCEKVFFARFPELSEVGAISPETDGSGRSVANRYFPSKCLYIQYTSIFLHINIYVLYIYIYALERKRPRTVAEQRTYVTLNK